MNAVARAEVTRPAPAVPVQRARPLLGTVVAIRLDACAHDADAAIDAAFAEIEAVHRAMSFHEADSELSRLNRKAMHTAQPVGTRLWRVLRAALALARASNGRFDPSIAAHLVRSGHLPEPLHAPTPDPHATWHDIELLPQRQVRFRRALWLDLGGIAKGYAVDRAVAVLRAHGAQVGVVNAGGDLRVFGDSEETVLVREPADPRRSRPLLQLREGAVATSAGYFSANAGGSALVDPHTKARLGSDVSVSVCAPRALWADALTKVVLAEPVAAAPLLRRLHAQAALLDHYGTCRSLP
ncbi:FAD:protein FMN transferase [Lysobacter tyrosinilyticus]